MLTVLLQQKDNCKFGKVAIGLLPKERSYLPKQVTGVEPARKLYKSLMLPVTSHLHFWWRG